MDYNNKFLNSIWSKSTHRNICNHQLCVCSSTNNDIALKKSLIEKKLEESGEKARLEEHLRQKLIECGWKDELKKYCLGRLTMNYSHCFLHYRFDQIKRTWKDKPWRSSRGDAAKGPCTCPYL